MTEISNTSKRKPGRPPGNKRDQLRRELEIAQLHAQGLSIAQVAAQLGYSPTSIWRILKRLYERSTNQNIATARGLEMARMDAVTRKLWPLLDSPNGYVRCKAGEVLVRISEHRSKIAGIEGDGTLVQLRLQTHFDAEVEALTSQLAEEHRALEASSVAYDQLTGDHPVIEGTH